MMLAFYHSRIAVHYAWKIQHCPPRADSVLSRNLMPNSVGMTVPLPYSPVATAFCDSTVLWNRRF